MGTKETNHRLLYRIVDLNAAATTDKHLWDHVGWYIYETKRSIGILRSMVGNLPFYYAGVHPLTGRVFVNTGQREKTSTRLVHLEILDKSTKQQMTRHLQRQWTAEERAQGTKEWERRTPADFPHPSQLPITTIQGNV